VADQVAQAPQGGVERLVGVIPFRAAPEEIV